jgi:hypothetical protein
MWFLPPHVDIQTAWLQCDSIRREERDLLLKPHDLCPWMFGTSIAFAKGACRIGIAARWPFVAESHKEEYMKQRVICLLGFIGVALGMSTISAQGQIIGQLEANIPFTFHAGGAKLPPGKYVIHIPDNTDLGLMEIQSADGRTSALFNVREAQDSTEPKKTELVFNHYGNRYFLSKLFDEGEKVGSAVIESGYSKQYASGGASDGEKEVPASHPGN